MFRIVTKKTIDNLRHELNEICTEQQRIEEENTRYRQQVVDLYNKVSHLEATREELEKQLGVFSDENSVHLTISDDLETVTPLIKVKEEMKEKMLQMGYLDDATSPDSTPFAMQLVLMNVAYEALDQIISAFAESVKDDD